MSALPPLLLFLKEDIDNINYNPPRVSMSALLPLLLILREDRQHQL
jgi:hypothetical protein